MRKSQIIAATLFLCAATAAHADLLVPIAENTSSINGTSGSLDFQFNPGPLVTQGATVQILNFSGGVDPLPATITIANTGAFNDYFQDFRYGDVISFTLDFGGPAVTAPNGMSTSGSLFTFSTFSDAAGVVPVLTSDPNGVALTVNVNLNGTLTTAAVSPDLHIVPEPASLWLLSGALAIFGGIRLVRRNA